MTGEKQEPLEGACCVQWDPDSESPPWAFQESAFIIPPGQGRSGEQRSYGGLRILKDGDYLTIYAKGMPRLVVWEGSLVLRAGDGFAPTQEGVHRQRWIHWFLNRHPATLVVGPEHREV